MSVSFLLVSLLAALPFLMALGRCRSQQGGEMSGPMWAAGEEGQALSFLVLLFPQKVWVSVPHGQILRINPQ